MLAAGEMVVSQNVQSRVQCLVKGGGRREEENEDAGRKVLEGDGRDQNAGMWAVDSS